MIAKDSKYGMDARRLKRLVEYDPATGLFTWVASHRAGMRAGAVTLKGYIQLCLDRHVYLAHRLAWLYMTGEWPAAEVDHINLDKADNRWANLRAATQSQNRANTRGTGRYGKGVYYDKRKRKFAAAFKRDGKRRHLGHFLSAEEAAQAYAEHSKSVFGEFAYKGGE